MMLNAGRKRDKDTKEKKGSRSATPSPAKVRNEEEDLTKSTSDVASDTEVVPMNHIDQAQPAEMEGNGEKEKSWFDLVYDFTQNTTVHGVRFITDKDSYCVRRCIWFCIFVSSFGFVTNQIVDRVIYFMSDPVMVKVEVNFNKTLNFPAVAICNQNAFRVTEAVRLGYRDILDSLYSPNSKPLDEILKSNPKADKNAGTIFSQLAHRKEDMIIRCSYNKQPCYPEDFTMEHTDHGVCYFYNYMQNKRLTATKTGSDAGLQLTLNVEQYEYMEGPHGSAGIKLLLFDRDNIPEVKELGHGVATGTHTFVGAEVLVMERIGPPKGNCRRVTTPLKYYPFYTDMACKMECLTRFVYNMCRCRIHYMPNIGGMEVCSLRKYLTCATRAKEQFEKREPNECKLCAPECKSTIYSPRFSYLTTASHDVDNVLKFLNGTQLLESYIKARDTNQGVDTSHYEEDKVFLDDILNLAHDVDNIVGKNLSQILTEQYRGIQEMFQYVQSIHSNMSELFKFQSFVVKKNFYRGAMAIDERTLLSVAKGFIEYLENFERNLRYLFTLKKGSLNDPTRELLYNLLKAELESKASMTDMAQQNVTQIKEAYLNAVPVFKYKYGGKSPIEHLLIPPNSVLSEAVTTGNAPFYLKEMHYALKRLREIYDNFGAILYDVYNEGKFNESRYAHEKRLFTSYIKRVNGLRSRVLEDVFAKPVQFVDNKIENFERLYSRIDTLWKQMEHDLAVLNQTVMMRDVIWTAMFEVVNKSGQYLQDVSIGKTPLCREITSIKTEQNTNKFNEFFETLRTRSRTLTDAWNTTFEAIMEFITDSLLDNDTYNYMLSNETDNGFLMTIEDLYDEDGFSNYTIALRDEIHAKQKEGDLSTQFGTKDKDFVAALSRFIDDCRVYLSGNKIDKHFYKNNFMSMDVYFSELNYELIQQHEAYTIISLLSDIGGSLGLFVGASVISIFELLDLFLFNYAKKKKKEQERLGKHHQNATPVNNDQYVKPTLKPAITA